MMRALGPVQPGWGKPNHGRHTVLPGDLVERCQGLRAPSVGKPTVQGTGSSPTHVGVVWPKSAVAVVVRGRRSGGGGMGRQPHAEGQEQDRLVHVLASYPSSLIFFFVNLSWCAHRAVVITCCERKSETRSNKLMFPFLIPSFYTCQDVAVQEEDTMVQP
jgi:hypothetical protein